jgi:hypothetical protein
MKHYLIKTFLLFFLIVVLFTSCSTDKTVDKGNDENPSYTDVLSSVLHIEGTKIINEKAEEVRLYGVNICSLEWNNKGDNVLKSVYEAFSNWNCNIVRLPLSQDRWFGKAPDSSSDGTQYRQLVDNIINLVSSFGKYVILDLHWNNADKWGENIGQHYMPDNYSVDFWVDIAKKYKNHPAVLFNLYNEPHDITWSVWKNGGTVTEKVDGETLTYTAPGLQKILNEIRAVGANNIIIAGGIDWAYDLTGVKTYALDETSKGNGIIYDSHIYPWKEWNGAHHDEKILCIADEYPIIIGEIGIDPDGEWGAASRPTWLKDMYDWIDNNNLHLAAWCFHTAATPKMLSDWNYTPTPWHGEITKARLLSYPDSNAHLDILPKKP